MDGAGITDSLITTLNVEENASLVARIYERELARMKADWQVNYAVYPFLPNQDMIKYV